MTNIIPLVQIEPALVEELLDAAFGANRKNRTAYKVREGMEMLEGLSMAAVDQAENELIATIQCWPVALRDDDGKQHPIIMVGPVAVHPDCQGNGIGRQLMEALFDELAENETLPLLLIGDPEYYGRFFGFSAERTSGWQLPGPWEPERLLLRADSETPLPANGILGPWARN
ncbi:Acetyltransferase [hydrothermal vent metagenome]|uniref:Acetyltransferase n=1 Tax=hydrothermal vent metagenome TaxID=652676 RepID=A0A3B0R1C1_9ZZZZ